MLIDGETLDDYTREYNNEGTRHFIRNLEESGKTSDEIDSILEQVEENLQWFNDEDEDEEWQVGFVDLFYKFYYNTTK